MQISIVAFDGFNEIDTFTTLGILNQMRGDGWRADLVCPSAKITSANGVTVASQRPLEWANNTEIVLFGSGVRMREVAADPKVLGRLQLDPERQLIGAQCSGSLLLRSLALLPGDQVCADQSNFAWLIQASLKPIAAPLLVQENIATAGGRLSGSYLAAWIIWKLDSLMAARHALMRVAPAGEEERYVAHVLAVVQPFIGSGEVYEPPATLVEAEQSIMVPAAVITPSPVVAPAPSVAAAPIEVLVEVPAPAASRTSAQSIGQTIFAGTVEARGKVATVQPMEGDVLRVMVVSETFNLQPIAVGDQVAVDGQMVTLVAKTEHSFKYDLTPAMVAATTNLEEPGHEVNLESVLKPKQRINHHLLHGAVDTIGVVLKLEGVGRSQQLVMQVDAEHGRCIANHGWIAINGVALSVAQVKDVQHRCIFSVLLDADLQAKTTLKNLKVGSKVHVELDRVALGVLAMLPANEAKAASKAKH